MCRLLYFCCCCAFPSRVHQEQACLYAQTPTSNSFPFPFRCACFFLCYSPKHQLLEPELDSNPAQKKEGETHTERVERYKSKVAALPKKNPSSFRKWEKEEAELFEKHAGDFKADYPKLQVWSSVKRGS